MIAEIRPGSGLEPVVYDREPSGALVSRTDWNTFEEHCYYFDELGSTRLIVNEQGNVTDRYTYDAWGNVTAHDQYTGSIGDSQPYRYVGRLGYYTHYQDQNMDLLQLGVRFCDPEIGRFTQVDPISYGHNEYLYANNAPIMLVDPSGLFAVGCAIGGIVGGAWSAFGGAGWQEALCNGGVGCLVGGIAELITDFTGGFGVSCVMGALSAIGGSLGSELCSRLGEPNNVCERPNARTCRIVGLLSGAIGGCLSGFVKGDEIIDRVMAVFLEILGQSATSACFNNYPAGPWPDMGPSPIGCGYY